MPLSKEEQAELDALEAKVSARATPRQLQEQSRRISGRLGIHPDTRQQPQGDTLEEFGGRVTDKTGSPLLGTAARMAPDIATSFMGFGAGGSVGRALGESVANPASRSLMMSSLKAIPTTPLRDVVRAAKTMFDEGETVTEGGIRNLLNKLKELQGRKMSILGSSPETVNLRDVGQIMEVTKEKLKRRGDWEAGVKAVEDIYGKLLSNPLAGGKSDIPVKLAEEIKQGISKEVSESAYRGGTTAVQGEALLAEQSALRNLVGEKVPQVIPINKRESDLLNVLSIGERRVATELRNNHVALGAIAKNPAAAALYMADKSSAFKSWLAHVIKNNVPGATERVGQTAGIGTAYTLKDISNGNAGSSAF